MPKGMNRANKPDNINYSSFTNEKSYVLGVLCGDGNMYKPKKYNCCSISLKVKNEDFALEFYRCLKTIYGLKMEFKKFNKVDNIYILGVKTTQNPNFLVRLNSKIAYYDLLQYDPSKSGFKTESWRVPIEIMNTNKEDIIINFIKGLYDSEGTLNRRGNAYAVRIYSKNIPGLKDVSVLLNKLRIDHKLYAYKMPFINISKLKNVEIFFRKIGSTIKYKSFEIPQEIIQYWGTYLLCLELNKKYGLTISQIAPYFKYIKKRTIRGWIENNKNPIEKSSLPKEYMNKLKSNWEARQIPR